MNEEAKKPEAKPPESKPPKQEKPLPPLRQCEKFLSDLLSNNLLADKPYRVEARRLLEVLKKA